MYLLSLLALAYGDGKKQHMPPPPQGVKRRSATHQAQTEALCATDSLTRLVISFDMVGMPTFFAVLLSIAASAAPTADAAHGPTPPLVISTLPFDNSRDQRAIFSSLRGPLEQALGRPVTFEAGESYRAVIDKLTSGTVDVAFVGAVAYLQARKHGKVHAILKTIRKGSANYRGVILVPAASTAKSPKELRGKRVAFVDQTSTSGYLYPRFLLKKSGLDPDHDIVPLFAGGHREVAEWVAAGKADAGACFDGAQDVLEDPSQVKVLARTTEIPGDPVVVGTTVPPELIKALRKALIDLAQNPGAAAFFNAAEIDGFVPAADQDYDTLAEQAAGSF